MDLLTKGSVFGTNHVIKGEKWAFRAQNYTRMTACVIKISHKVLFDLANQNNVLYDALSSHKEYLKTKGLMQIDYIIDDQ